MVFAQQNILSLMITGTTLQIVQQVSPLACPALGDATWAGLDTVDCLHEYVVSDRVTTPWAHGNVGRADAAIRMVALDQVVGMEEFTSNGARDTTGIT